MCPTQRLKGRLNELCSEQTCQKGYLGKRGTFISQQAFGKFTARGLGQVLEGHCVLCRAPVQRSHTHPKTPGDLVHLGQSLTKGTGNEVLGVLDQRPHIAHQFHFTVGVPKQEVRDPFVTEFVGGSQDVG